MLTQKTPFRAKPRSGCYFNSTFKIKPNAACLPARKSLRAKSTLKAKNLKAVFSRATRELFHLAPCWAHEDFEFGLCSADCLHHIFGRVSASPFNAAPMNNNRCHINRNGKMGQHLTHMKPEAQQMYLRRTITWLTGIYEITEADKEFLNKYASPENLKLAFENFRVESDNSIILR